MGDFNFRELVWNDETLFDSSNRFVKCVNDNFLFQKTNRATRGENILDLIFVSDTDMVNQLDVGEPFETSDHNIIRFNLQVHEKQKDTPMRTNFNYFKTDYDIVRQDLIKLDWNSITDTDNVEAIWCGLKT